MSLLRRLGWAVAGGTLARGALLGLQTRPPGGAVRWSRPNHSGGRVSLLAGPAAALAGTLTMACSEAPGSRTAALLAGGGSGAVGLYDDIVGQRPEQRADKGFAGHLAALRQGRVSAGVVKVGGVGFSALLAARPTATSLPQRVVAAGVIAGTANLINLLDLRPGRALKVVLLVATAQPQGAALTGVSIGLLPADLGEQVMLGDCGANSLGALLGLALAQRSGPRTRILLLLALVAITAASEKVSFTRVIESTPGLREFDALGRRRSALRR